jgi:hypothetical protein
MKSLSKQLTLDVTTQKNWEVHAFSEGESR